MVESKCVVFGGAVILTSFISDMAVGITDFIGGRSGAQGNKLAEGRRITMLEMIESASEIKVDGIAGVRDYETIGKRLMMILAYGNAVTLEPPAPPAA